MKNLLLIAVLLLPVLVFSQSPGGVSGNLRWWLKADAGTFTDNGTTAATDGQNVQQWNDQSTIVNHVRQTTGANKPVYRTGIINGYPVLRFSSDQFLDALASPGVGVTESFYMFLIFKQNSYSAGGTTDGSGTYIMDRTSATNNLMSFKIANTDKYFYQKRNDAGGSLTGPVSVTSAVNGSFVAIDYFRNVGTSYGIYINGRLDVTSGGDSENITGPQLRIGRHTSTANGGLDGDLAEVILYNANLSAASRTRIESYLAIKYGITLDQTTATNYVNSSGTIVYPAVTSHDLYDNDIAGIARDDNSALNQPASQSQNTLSIVRILNPSSLDDGDFLIWGHNAPTIWNSTDVPSPYINRLTRIWRAAETGDVGSFSISFDLTGLGIDMTDPTRFALLVDTDGNFSDASAHTTGRTIVGNVVSFTGALINNNDYFSLACPLIPGPGGVAATTVWLRADEDVYVNAGTTLATNGQTVQQWTTRNGLTVATASQSTPANRPTYLTNIMNGNPVLRFSSSNFLDLGTLGIGTTSDLNMSVVVRPSTLNGGTLTNTTGGYIVDRTTNTVPVFSLKLLSGGTAALQERIDSNPPFDGPSTNTVLATSRAQIIDYSRDYAVRYGIYFNGALENILADAGGALTFPVPRIGALQSGDNGLIGDFSEFIMYNRDLNTSERNRIDSYLAIKYGITLDQTSLTNYTASTGTVVYPATSTHATYNKDIAGIARDAASRLNQSNSQSANSNSVVRMQSPSSLDDLDFLMWGSNGGNLSTRNTLDVDGSLIKGRMSRVWRAAETGETGTVTVSFDLTMVGAKTQADLRLLIDRDGDGFADNDVAPLTGTLTGDVFTVTGVNFQNNDYFTIGSTNLTTTPLPVELVSFDGAYENPVVSLNWQTASELNNDYFTLERSASGTQFETLAKISGAGTSSQAHSYSYIDASPFPKVTYYRLKQTDYDGASEYSKIIRVETSQEKERKMSVYPNPNSGTEITLTLDSRTPFQLNGLEILSQQNVMLESFVPETGSASEYNFRFGRQLARGLYIVRIRYNNKLESVKLLVQ
ncbi:MAG: T9SS type A sorting domain-containing protein [Cyclobacteriaceae bacterium]